MQVFVVNIFNSWTLSWDYCIPVPSKISITP